MALQALFQKWGSATGTTRGTDKGTTHAYAQTYEDIFSTIMDQQPVRRVLEIGVDSGASLAAWAEYFPEAQVVGLDVSLANWHLGTDHPRVTAYQADATDREVIPWDCLTQGGTSTTFDVIVDDGSHEDRDQLRALEVGGPSLSEEGVYVIEDVNLHKHPHLSAALKWTAATLGLDCEILDLRGPGTPPDEVLAVCRRRGKKMLASS